MCQWNIRTRCGSLAGEIRNICLPNSGSGRSWRGERMESMRRLNGTSPGLNGRLIVLCSLSRSLFPLSPFKWPDPLTPFWIGWIMSQGQTNARCMAHWTMRTGARSLAWRRGTGAWGPSPAREGSVNAHGGTSERLSHTLHSRGMWHCCTAKLLLSSPLSRWCFVVWTLCIEIELNQSQNKDTAWNW